MEVNINSIRDYNKKLQDMQKKATNLQATVDYKKTELEKLCKELSELTGENVTPANVVAFADKIDTAYLQTLKTGNEVLARAEAEEKRVDAVVTAQAEDTSNEVREDASKDMFVDMPSFMSAPKAKNKAIKEVIKQEEQVEEEEADTNSPFTLPSFGDITGNIDGI